MTDSTLTDKVVDTTSDMMHMLGDMVMTPVAATVAAVKTVATTPTLAPGVYESGITPYRSNCYTGMNTLTSSYVQKNGVKLLWECDVPGDYRGSEHQPLVVPNILQKDGTTCSILLLTTMSNDVYCFDYDKADPANPTKGRCIWKQRIGNPVNISQYDVNGTWKNPYDMYPINRPFWGSLSCPYIDKNTMTAYICNASSPDGTMPKVRYYLHAIDLTTGVDKCAPLDISTAVYQSPGGTIAHDASPRKQRSALAFYSYNNGTNDIIFICDSTFAMMGNVAHGFVVAADVTGIRTSSTMKIACCWTATCPPYAGTGIWMAGQGPAVDADGNLFIVGANGAFDPPTCFGSADVKLKFTPATSTTAATITPVTWAAWYTDSGRDGYDPTIPWIGLVANYSGVTDGMDMTAKYDQDLGCAQGAYLPASITGFTDNLFIDCGKDGIAHGQIADAMANTMITDFAPDKIQANYAKALFVTGATFYPATFNITPTDLGTMSTTVGGYTHHQHSNPPWYVSVDHGVLIYYGGENGPVRVFQVKQTGKGKYSMTYLATGLEVASPNEPAPGGMPGTFMSLSCVKMGDNTAMLHALQPQGNGNNAIVPGRYIIYGANWINETNTPDIGPTLIKIWDSADWNINFSYCKFGHPTPCMDKIVIPTYDARVLIFG